MNDHEQLVQDVAKAISDDGVNWENRMLGPRKRLWLRRAAIAVEIISAAQLAPKAPAERSGDGKGEK